MDQKFSMRVTALEMASRHGMPPNATLAAARDYLAFLDGTSVRANWELVTDKLAKDLVFRATRGGGVDTHAPTAKAKPRKTSRRAA